MTITASSDWFSSRLLKWYDLHGRHDLPWKEPIHPYRVWISEIMLQQTQVSTVIPYFLRFMERFPTVEALSLSPINIVLHHWAGLGYYARAKNLHRAANIIVNDWQGRFSKRVEDWTQLPGVGLSTAGAIVSQSFNLRAPILDGNVKRVLCRFNGVTGWPGQKDVEKSLWALSEHYTPADNAAHFTQAMMDLGATCCTRRHPQCQVCPLKPKCYAFKQQVQHELPEKRPSKVLPTKMAHILVLQTECGHWLLEQRPMKGIWSGLWTFPEFENTKTLKDYLHSTLAIKRAKIDQLEVIKHTFSHYHFHLIPSYVVIKKIIKKTVLLKNRPLLAWVNAKALRERGLPAPIQMLIQKLGASL